MSEEASTREKLIAAARELFWEQGYHATGLKQILETAGVRSGSLYHAFSGKEDLLLAVLERYLDLLQPMVVQPAFETTSDPIERIFSILDGYRTLLLRTECTRGCPIGNLALELGDARPAVREKIAQNFSNWCAAVESCLDIAIDRLPGNLDRRNLSRFVLTVMEGGIMQARAHKSIELYDSAVTQLKQYFALLLADGANAA